jgi:hypothetical protein
MIATMILEMISKIRMSSREDCATSSCTRFHYC